MTNNEMKHHVTKRDILSSQASFTWMFDHNWFVETPFGNFHWSDPSYEGGDNTFVLFDGNYIQFRRFMGVDTGRDKGWHEVERYCGSDIKITLSDFVLPQPVHLNGFLQEKFPNQIPVNNPEMKAFIDGWNLCLDTFRKSGTEIK